jgi:hypothetical protein
MDLRNREFVGMAKVGVYLLKSPDSLRELRIDIEEAIIFCRFSASSLRDKRFCNALNGIWIFRLT